jgi:hypothetical protein
MVISETKEVVRQVLTLGAQLKVLVLTAQMSDHGIVLRSHISKY